MGSLRGLGDERPNGAAFLKAHSDFYDEKQSVEARVKEGISVQRLL